MKAVRPFVLAAIVLLAVLAGCSSLLDVKRQPFTIYSPQLEPAAATRMAAVDWQLVVETPLASDTLDTARMLVMPTPGVLEVFPGARWSDPAPALLRSLVVEGFEDSGRIAGVGSAASGMRADYALAIELRDLQLEIPQGPSAVVRFQARLLDYTSNRVLAARGFEARQPAAGTDAAQAFLAFQAALNQAVAEVVDWTLREGSRARAAPDPG
jgi:cholesterol transport system auxiliary component